MDNKPLTPPTITNIVVVMLENRSYDNILGWLDGHAGAVPNLDSHGNSYAAQNAATTVVGPNALSYPGTGIPVNDPAEVFGSMAQQFLDLGAVPESAPYAGYKSESAPMTGFVKNYETARKAPTSSLPDVMNYFVAEQLPVTQFLATNYGVCERWFASAPTHTFTNRVFALCAAPAIITAYVMVEGEVVKKVISLVNDADYAFHLGAQLPESNVIELPTLCSRLDAANAVKDGPNWKLYFHDYSIAALTIPYVASAAQNAKNENVSTFDSSDWGGSLPTQLKHLPSTFLEDVTNDKLPPFSFIEPRYNRHLHSNLPPNSNHPGPGDYGLFTKSTPEDPPIDVVGGELLLMQVYNLLVTTTNWPSTLLIITYDEPGGTYDHVAPPTAIPPGTVHLDTPSPLPKVPPAWSTQSNDPAADGFGFHIYGGRVPAIIVSPLVPQGTRFVAQKGEFDHTSIIRTVWEAFGLDAAEPPMTSLTDRDASAPSLRNQLSSAQLNEPGPYSGAMMANPSAVILNGSVLFGVKDHSLLVANGSGDAVTVTSVSTADGRSWLSAKVNAAISEPFITAITVSVDKHHLKKNVYGGSIVLGCGTDSLTVQVTLNLT